jgi:biotin carboxylase
VRRTSSDARTAAQKEEMGAAVSTPPPGAEAAARTRRKWRVRPCCSEARLESPPGVCVSSHAGAGGAVGHV